MTTEEGRQALAALLAIWTATGQLEEEEHLGLECPPGPEGCTASIGFDHLAEGAEATAEAADAEAAEAIDRLRRGWKSTLAREGKLRDPGDDD